jgi:hypothetical protein
MPRCQPAAESRIHRLSLILRKGGNVQIFENDSKQTKSNYSHKGAHKIRVWNGVTHNKGRIQTLKITSNM